MTTQPSERALPVARSLGTHIVALMWEKRATQTAMGQAIGIGQTTMGKKLRGLVPITVDELVAIADYLGEDPADLLRARRDSNPKPSDWGLLVSAGVDSCRLPRALVSAPAVLTLVKGGLTVNRREPSSAPLRLVVAS